MSAEQIGFWALYVSLIFYVGYLFWTNPVTPEEYKELNTFGSGRRGEF